MVVLVSVISEHLMQQTLRYLLIFLFGILCVGNSFSQWTNVAQGLLGNSGTDPGGRIIYKNGIIWAGKKDVWMSADMGKTWSKRSPIPGTGGDVVMDIMFLDAMVGIVVVFDGMYLTKDQGVTWRYFTVSGSSGSFNSGSLSGNANNIILTSNGGDVYVSNNGGLTWVSKIKDGCAFNVLGGNDASVYVLAGSSSGGKMYISYDFGNTWRQTPGTYDWDCFSLARDICDTNTFYIANEDIIAPTDGKSCVFRSTNSGLTWTKHNPQSLPYHSGSISSVEGAVFVQTYEGIDRSTDKGITWKSINGPSLPLDTRCVATVTNNLIISTDEVDGSIFITNNSGGDSLSAAVGGKPIEFTPKILFSADTVCTDTVDLLRIIHPVCNAATITDISIEGADSSSYRVKNTYDDSLVVEFSPIGIGRKNAIMIIRSSNGGIDTIQLNGFSKNVPFVYSVTPDTLFQNDTLWLCEGSNRTIHVSLSSCMLPLVVSERIVGLHPGDYAIQDPLPVQPSFDQDIVISFNATSSGFRSATYELKLSNGTTISVPLKGYAKPSIPLSLTTSDKSTDTIGASVQIPISLNGLVDKKDIELVLHYDEGLDYEGSFSPSGAPLDMNGQQWDGRSKLFIPNAVSGAPLGYANFIVFADSASLPKVTFDSVVVLNTASPCEYILPAPIISTITPPSGCGIQIISRFVHLGEKPTIRLYPNPANDNISLVSDSDLLDAEVIVIDMLAAEKRRYTGNIKANTAFPIDLTSLANGVYSISVTSPTSSSRLSFVLSR